MTSVFFLFFKSSFNKLNFQMKGKETGCQVCCRCEAQATTGEPQGNRANMGRAPPLCSSPGLTFTVTLCRSASFLHFTFQETDFPRVGFVGSDRGWSRAPIWSPWSPWQGEWLRTFSAVSLGPWLWRTGRKYHHLATWRPPTASAHPQPSPPAPPKDVGESQKFGKMASL